MTSTADFYDFLAERYNARARFARSLQDIFNYQPEFEMIEDMILSNGGIINGAVPCIVNPDSYFNFEAQLAFELLLTMPKPKSGKPKALEIGQGVGQALQRLDLLGFDTTGVELSKKMCELSQKNSPNSKIINADILDLKIPDASFDIIFAHSVICLLKYYDGVKLIEKIKKWLKPHGFLFLSTGQYPEDFEGHVSKSDLSFGKIPETNMTRFKHHYSKESLLKLLGIVCDMDVAYRYLMRDGGPGTERLFQNCICRRR